MKEIILPVGFRFERLTREHPRREFQSGQALVDEWLRTKAWQHQEKRLSTTCALVDENGTLAGYFTIATSQAGFADLPGDVTRGLPKRNLPIAVLAWLGVDARFQGRGFGSLLLARALRDCHEAGKHFAFVAVVLDCVDELAKAFYQRWHFREIPGKPMRLFLSAAELEAIMRGS